MKFPNAYAGVKKLFTAEILSIIGSVAMIISAFFSLMALASTKVAETNPDAYGAAGLFLILFAVFLIIAAVFAVISAILQIVGLNTGRKDEELFGTALKFVLIFLICIVVSAVISNIEALSGSIPGKIIGGFTSTLGSISQIMVVYYIIQGIMSLAKKCNNEKLEKKGKTLITLILIILLISLVATVLGSFVLTGVAAGILALVGAILAFVSYIIYLTYLAQAKKMLAKAE